MNNVSAIGRLSRAIAFAAAAGLAAGAVAPAIASAQQDAPASQAEPKKQQKYCMRVESTGSRVVQRECKTREAWIKEYGVDPVRAN